MATSRTEAKGSRGRDHEQSGPTAYRGPFPIPGHRTMAEIMAAESHAEARPIVAQPVVVAVDHEQSGPTAYRGPFPIPGHRTMAEIMAAESHAEARPIVAQPVVVAVDHARGPDVCATATFEEGLITKVIFEPAVPVQRKCRTCGDSRVSACRYRTCPLPRGGDLHV